jgi:hypothetical protein
LRRYSVTFTRSALTLRSRWACQVASGILARYRPHKMPITDLAMWLDHPNINLSYATYGRLVPSSLGRVQEVLNAEYTQWSKGV